MDANILEFTPHFLFFKNFLLTQVTMFMSSLFLFLLVWQHLFTYTVEYYRV